MQIQHQAARKGENVPVASWLLPKRQRAAVLMLYDYARGMDDLADDPARSPTQREQALLAVADHPPLWAQRYFDACARGELSAQVGERLMQAFLLDARQDRYADWDALIQYCDYSAASFGRGVLRIWDEEQTANAAACDALCRLLQILNHLQDIGSDYHELGRIYLPQDMMAAFGVSDAMLGAPQMSAPLRALVNAMLDRAQPLLAQARDLPPSIASCGLRMQAAWVVRIAARLTQKLYAQDALAGRVKLTRTEYFAALFYEGRGDGR